MSDHAPVPVTICSRCGIELHMADQRWWHKIGGRTYIRVEDCSPDLATRAELEAELADWQRHGVKVTSHCYPTCQRMAGMLDGGEET